MFGTLDPSLGPIIPELGASPEGEIVAESGAVFRLETVLGAGGFGIVVRARFRITSAIAYDDDALNGALNVLRELTGSGDLWIPCALKFVRPSMSRWEAFDEFHREAMAWIGCAEPYPHVLRAYGLEFTGTGVPFLQLELARGGSLAGRLGAGPLAPGTVAAVLAQVAGALTHAGREIAHGSGSFSHGDLKPANILLAEAPRPNPEDPCYCDSCIAEWVQGPLRVRDSADAPRLRGLPRVRQLIAKLTDFGMASLAGRAGGTPAYMAPEQFDGDRGSAVDVYALGVTAFELLAGERPFENVAPQALEYCHKSVAPPSMRDAAPQTPGPLADLVDACLAKQPTARPTLDALRSALDALAPALGLDAGSRSGRLASPLTVTHRGPGNHAPGARMRLVRGIEGLTALGTTSAFASVTDVGSDLPSDGWDEDGTYSVVKEWEAAAEHQLGVALGAPEPVAFSNARKYQRLVDAALPEPTGAALYVQQRLKELHGGDTSRGLFFYPYWGVDTHVRAELAVTHPPFLGHVLTWELLLALHGSHLPLARSRLVALRARDFLLVKPWRHRLEGLVALAEGAIAEAREWFEAGVDASPGDAITRSNLAVALWRHGARSSALEHAERAWHELPLHGEVTSNWLIMSHAQGAWTKTQEEASRQLPSLRYPTELGAEPAPVMRWDVHPPLIWDVDDAWLTLEALAEVRRTLARKLERELTNTPTDPRGWFQAAAYWAAAGDELRARRCLERSARYGGYDSEVTRAISQLEDYLAEQQLEGDRFAASYASAAIPAPTLARGMPAPSDVAAAVPAPTLAAVIQDHEMSLGLASSTLKDAAERDQSHAPIALRTASRNAEESFAPVRKEMTDETRDLAAILNVGPMPADFDIRVLRLSLAAYLLDKVDEMFQATNESDGTVRVALFVSAARAVRNILDDLFFFKSADQIIRDYLDNETAIVSCATACNVELCSLEQAVAAYKKKVAAEVDAINDGIMVEGFKVAIERGAERGFVLTIPELPGCIGQVEKLEDAPREMARLIAVHLVELAKRRRD